MPNSYLLIKWVHNGRKGLGTLKNSGIHYTNSSKVPALIIEAEVPRRKSNSFGDPLNQSSICWMTNTSTSPASELNSGGMQNKARSLPSAVNNANSADNHETIRERLSLWSSIKQKLAETLQGSQSLNEGCYRNLLLYSPTIGCTQWNWGIWGPDFQAS